MSGPKVIIKVLTKEGGRSIRVRESDRKILCGTLKMDYAITSRRTQVASKKL